MNDPAPNKPNAADVRVWDLFVRLFHWSLVVTALTCLLTEDDSLGLHVVAGYAVGLLVAARIVWGFVGPPPARFANFTFRPAITAGYLGDLVRLRAQRYLGHSPAGGTMILLQIVTLVGLVGTGLAAYAAEEHAGPLAAIPQLLRDLGQDPAAVFAAADFDLRVLEDPENTASFTRSIIRAISTSFS